MYSELFPCTTKLTDLKFRPVGLILSGGPYSVYDEAVGQLLAPSFSFQIYFTSFHDAWLQKQQLEFHHCPAIAVCLVGFLGRAPACPNAMSGSAGDIKNGLGRHTSGCAVWSGILCCNKSFTAPNRTDIVVVNGTSAMPPSPGVMSTTS